MSHGPNIWIAVPCYNEAVRFNADAFVDFISTHLDYGFVFINDASTDATADVIEAIVNRFPTHARALMLGENVGKAEAVRLGMLSVMNDANVVGYFDADLATPLDELPRLRAELEDASVDMVLGSRVRLLGRTITRRALRHYVGRVFATAASLTLGLNVYDTQCGAKLLRVGPWLERALREPFCGRWVFDVELIGRYMRLTNRRRYPDEPCGIIEVPLRVWHDVAGSALRPMDFFRAFRDLWRIRRALRNWEPEARKKSS